MSDTYRRLASTDFDKGSNCAQAVLAAFARDPLLDGAVLTPGMGAGFGSGVGGTGCLCGALAGSVMVAGAYVDTLGLEPVAARQLSEQLADELVARFKDRYGATCCRVIRRKFCEGTADVHHCNALVDYMRAQTTEVLTAHIAEHDAAAIKRSHIFDVLNRASRVALGIFASDAVVCAVGLLVPLPHAVRVALLVVLGVSGLYALGMDVWRRIHYHRR